MKKSKLFFSLFLLGSAIAVFVYLPKLKTLYHAINLFEEDRIVENFRSFDQHWPVSRLAPSPRPFVYPKGKEMTLPENFNYAGKNLNTRQFLQDSRTTGFIIIQNDSIVHEAYYLGNTEDTKNISWSMAKSFISALMGIALEEGHIKSIAETVEVYVPELKGSAYDGVRIKDVLQMASGVEFDEDYGDFYSDINRWGRGFALGKSQDEFAKTLTRNREPGTFHHYVSINTHVLGMILTRATGTSVTKYMQEKFWTPVGMEKDAYWVVDDTGMELVLGGLNATLRDYAKIGSLFLNKGLWRGEQIVPEEWISLSTTPDEPYLQPGENPNSAHDIGYGYQWWIPESSQGEFMAQGVYNQIIYVNPETRTVIAKLSANHRFNDKTFVPSRHDAVLALFREIAMKRETASL